MSSNGRAIYKLKELCTKIGSGATPRGGKESYINEGPYALIRSQNVLDFFFSNDGLVFIDEDQADQLRNVELQERDVLLNITGDSVARVCQVPKEILPARVNQHVIIVRPDANKLNPEYLKYFLLNPKFKNYMEGLSSVGGTRNALTKGMIEDFEIDLPPMMVQERISAILSVLDDKIELNHRINISIKSIGESIFNEWFVKFKFPGSTGQMHESELGMIPLEWKVGRLHDILNIEIGGDWGKDNTFDGGVAAISLRGTDLEQLKTSGYALNAPIRWIKKNSLDKRNITNRDILIAGSGLGPIGRSIYCADSLQDLYAHPITYSNFCKRLRAETPALAIYAERILESIYNRGEMRQYFTGTSIPNLDVQSLLAHKIVIPQGEILDEYYEIIGKNKFYFLFSPENIYLSQIRNELLPKLMRGEIDL